MNSTENIKWKIIEDLMDLNGGFDQYGDEGVVAMVTRVVTDHSHHREEDIRREVRQELDRMFIRGELSMQMRFEV